MTDQKPSFSISDPVFIGGKRIRNRSFLAPMSGITDVAFRKLAWEFGAGVVVSEMVASEALLTGHDEMNLKMMSAGLPIHMVQLAGREPHWMALAAKMAQDNGADIIDINMGCPAKRVTTGYSGSALMRDLNHANSLIEAVVEAVEVPVTLKMRLGWDDQTINAPDLARRATNAGVQMITVHGRTRCQFYKGKANWEKVSLVREATDLPLVVNGDIVNEETASLALSQSGADVVMVGRGAYGAPWQPGLIAGVCDLKSVDVAETAIRHYQGMLSLYGKEGAIRPARKHLGWYLDNTDNSEALRSIRQRILTSFDPDEVVLLLGEALSNTRPTSSLAA